MDVWYTVRFERDFNWSFYSFLAMLNYMTSLWRLFLISIYQSTFQVLLTYQHLSLTNITFFFSAFILNLKSHFPPITVVLILLFDALIRKAQSSFPQEEPFYSLSLLRFTFTWSCDVKVIFSLQLFHYWLARITVKLYEATSRVLVKESSENDSTNHFFLV